MLEQVRATISPLAEKNGNTLNVVYDESIGQIHCDLVKVRQSLINLLSNACKFTEAGTVELSAQRVVKANQEFILFAVKDSGIGMSEDQLARIFTAFGQADNSTTRRYGGTGLGLTITQHFAEMLGGELSVTSEPGKGSVFTLELPAQPTEVKTVEVTEAAQPTSPTGEGPLVLVIDDDSTARDLMSRTLQRNGFSVATAPGGAEGLRLAAELQPAAITLDVMMPDVDGWKVLRSLKADPATADIPVVMVTILHDQALAFSLGATDFLTKPVDRNRLVKTLSTCGPGKNQLALVVDDDPDARELTKRMLLREGWRVQEAENGIRALEQIAQEKPDLVMLDLMMPEMDGFGFIETVRADAELQSLPIVVLSAKILTAEEQQFLERTVAQVVSKGAQDQNQLLEQIVDIVKERTL
jgi:CheY-like chemotaxis protein